MTATRPVAFALPRHRHFLDTLCGTGKYDRGELSEKVFPNGEYNRHVVNIDACSDRDVIVIGGTDDDDIVRLFDFCSCFAAVAKTLSIVIPYYRYGTQERVKTAGEVRTAETRAMILSAIPKAKVGNRVLMFDLHAEQKTLGFFDPTRIQPIAVRCTAVLEDAIRQRFATELSSGALVVASADSGRSELIETLSASCGVGKAFVDKKRISGTEVRFVGEVIGDVRGKIVLIVDDMIRSGGTAAGAAELYLGAGAREVWLVATHGDFVANSRESDGTFKLLRQSRIRGVITTDSYHRALETVGLQDRPLEVVSIARIIDEAVSRPFAN